MLSELRPDYQMPVVLKSLGFEASEVKKVSVEIEYFPPNSYNDPEPNCQYINLDGTYLKVYLELGNTLDELGEWTSISGEMILKDGTCIMLHYVENECDPMWLETTSRNGKMFMHVPLS